jgi:hypothetical protein
MKLFFIFVVFSIFTVSVSSQKILLLEKPGTVNNIKYRIGDRIDIYTKEKINYSGIITYIGDSTINVNYSKIKISEIQYINIRRLLPSIINGIGVQGGLAYIGIDCINNSINNETPILRKTTLKTGLFFLGTGLLADIFSKSKRKIDGKKWRISILDFDK